LAEVSRGHRSVLTEANKRLSAKVTQAHAVLLHFLNSLAVKLVNNQMPRYSWWEHFVPFRPAFTSYLKA
jgi:hypothetical protein